MRARIFFFFLMVSELVNLIHESTKSLHPSGGVGRSQRRTNTSEGNIPHLFCGGENTSWPGKLHKVCRVGGREE